MLEKKFLFSSQRQFKYLFGCVNSEEETPVPIPNTVVKLISGDGTAALAVGEQHDAALYFFFSTF